MKRLFASLVAMAMVLALVACGGGDSKSTGGSSAGGSSAGGSTGGTSTSTSSGSGSGSGSGGGSSAGGSAITGKEGGTELTFGTGGETGTYYAFGNVIGNKVGDMTSTSVTAVSSGGSAANIDGLSKGDFQIAFVQSDVMSYAYNGERSFKDQGAYDGFSTVAALYMEQVQIVTVNPDIKTVADLAGKKVSIGASGSGVFYNAIDVLGIYGLTEQDIVPTYQDFAGSAEALQDGQIDAAFIVAGAPTTAVTSLAASKPISLVSLDDEHIDQLIEQSPYYSKNVISKDVYGTSEDCTTVAVGAVIIANDDVSDVDVYNFLVGTFEDIPNLSHDKASELNLEFASSVTSVGYHPGAVAYFADKGITVPGK